VSAVQHQPQDRLQVARPRRGQLRACGPLEPAAYSPRAVPQWAWQGAGSWIV